MDLPLWSEEAGFSNLFKTASGTEDGVGVKTGSWLNRSTGLTLEPERIDSLRDLIAASPS